MTIPAPVIARNTAGSKDLSFGNTTPKDGTSIFNIRMGFSRVLSDGSTITVGAARVEGNDFVLLTKHDKNGEFDFDYGVVYNLAVGPIDLFQLMIQADEKPVILATPGTAGMAFITRFTTTCHVDTSFGDNGSVILQHGIQTYPLPVAGLAQQADGHIIATFSNYTSSLVYQLTESGVIRNFGKPGPIEIANAQFNALLITESGFIIAGTNADRAQLQARTHNGDPDPAFGINGIVDLAIKEDSGTPHAALVAAMALGPNGRIAVAGHSRYIPSRINFVTYLLANGQPDARFNNGVPLQTGIGNGLYASVVVQGDEKIVAMARVAEYGTPVNLIRHTLAGQWDPLFGNGGVAEVYRDGSSRPLQTSISHLEKVGAEEKMQASGYFGQDSFLARLLSR